MSTGGSSGGPPALLQTLYTLGVDRVPSSTQSVGALTTQRHSLAAPTTLDSPPSPNSLHYSTWHRNSVATIGLSSIAFNAGVSPNFFSPPSTEEEADLALQGDEPHTPLAGASQPLLALDSLFADANKLKKACRNGLPVAQRAEIYRRILHSLHIKMPAYDPPYSQLKEEIFQTKSHRHSTISQKYYQRIPDFGSPADWRMQSRLFGLPIKRLDIAKTMVCVLSAHHPDLIYAPFMIDLICFGLAVGMDEDNLWDFIHRILLKSKHDSWFFPLGAGHYLCFIQTFGQLLKKELPQLHKHLSSLQIEPELIFGQWVQRLFVNFVPMNVVSRFMDAWMSEGSKIFYRLALALFKVYKKPLMAEKSSGTALLMTLNSQLMNSSSSVNSIFSTAFDISLSRSGIAKVYEAQVEQLNKSSVALWKVPAVKRTIFRLPHFVPDSSDLMTQEQCYALWSFLGDSLRILDPTLLYTSASHGFSLDSLISRCDPASHGLTEHSVIILVKDTKYSVFGAFFPHEIGGKQSKIPVPLDGRAFVFQLTPTPQVYKHFVMRQMEEAEAAAAKIIRRNASRAIEVGQANVVRSSSPSDKSPARSPSTGRSEAGSEENTPIAHPYVAADPAFQSLELPVSQGQEMEHHSGLFDFDGINWKQKAALMHGDSGNSSLGVGINPFLSPFKSHQHSKSVDVSAVNLHALNAAQQQPMPEGHAHLVHSSTLPVQALAARTTRHGSMITPGSSVMNPKFGALIDSRGSGSAASRPSLMGNIAASILNTRGSLTAEKEKERTSDKAPSQSSPAVAPVAESHLEPPSDSQPQPTHAKSPSTVVSIPLTMAGHEEKPDDSSDVNRAVAISPSDSDHSSQSNPDDEESDAAYIIWSTDSFGIADSHGYAFELNRELREGHTKATRVFGNPPLTSTQADGTFSILAVEVWGFKVPHS